jgi:hypothetical protein
MDNPVRHRIRLFFINIMRRADAQLRLHYARPSGAAGKKTLGPRSLKKAAAPTSPKEGPRLFRRGTSLM